MVMTLHQTLLQLADSNELKVRLKNRQIKLNNEVVTDTKIEFPTDETFNKVGYMELGEFIYENIDRLRCHMPWYKVWDIRDFFGPGETNIPWLAWLSDYDVVVISKKEQYVFRRKSPGQAPEPVLP